MEKAGLGSSHSVDVVRHRSSTVCFKLVGEGVAQAGSERVRFAAPRTTVLWPAGQFVQYTSSCN